MRENFQVLQGYIELAREGDGEALATLRRIIARSADAAPPDAILSISEHLLSLGVDLDRKNVEKN